MKIELLFALQNYFLPLLILSSIGILILSFVM